MKIKIRNRIESFLKKQFYNLGINLVRNTKINDIKKFISKFKKNYIHTNLIRVGGNGDGGYLVPNVLKDVNICMSAGVGDISKFEKELSDTYDIKSFMIDGSVDSPPENNKNFFFLKKYLSSETNEENITLSDWILKNSITKTENVILQMDIEGSEYEVLTYESSQTLANFSLLIVEFHKFENISNPVFCKMLNSIFDKIYQNFKICHVHPNNFSGIYNFKNIKIPSTIEVTFIRNDLVLAEKSENGIVLPHSLDQKNVKTLPNINMPEIWWKQNIN